MNPKQTQVLVHGGTGVQGRPVALAFLNGGYPTRVITRQPDKANALSDAGAIVVQADLADVDSLRRAYDGVQIITLQIPFFVEPSVNPITYMENAVQAAKDTGVSHIIWNTGGLLLDDPIGRPSVDFRYHLYQVLNASGIPHTVFAPTMYMENLMGPWTANGIIQENVLAYPLPPDVLFGMVTVNDVAKLVVAAANNATPSNEIHGVNGPTPMTGDRMAEQFSAALGRKINYAALTPQAFGEQIAVFFGEEAGRGLADDYTATRANLEQLLPYHDMSSVLEKYPVTMTSLENWVRQHAFAFNTQPDGSSE